MNNQNHELNAGIGYNVFELACPLASFCCLAQHVKKKKKIRVKVIYVWIL